MSMWNNLSFHGNIKAQVFMNKEEKNEISLSRFRAKNKNLDFTLIARDCIGGVLYHQLGLKFLSPTINLFLTLEDFNYFCLNLKDYVNGELEEYIDNDVSYPVGVLKSSSVDRPIRIDFMHYSSFEEAKNKWNERKARINYDNLFVVSSCCYKTEIETLNDKIIEDWNKIPYKKVILVDKEYGFDDEFVVQKHKDCKDFAWLLYTPSKTITWKRAFNKFNFIKFLNGKHR